LLRDTRLHRRVGEGFDNGGIQLCNHFAAIAADAWPCGCRSTRVRNLADKKYAIWADPGYPDQVILGAPRTYEFGAAFKF